MEGLAFGLVVVLLAVGLYASADKASRERQEDWRAARRAVEMEARIIARGGRRFDITNDADQDEMIDELIQHGGRDLKTYAGKRDIREVAAEVLAQEGAVYPRLKPRSTRR